MVILHLHYYTAWNHSDQQPAILVRFYDESMADQFFVVIEQRLDIECPDIQRLFHTFYCIYNLHYHTKARGESRITSGRKKTELCQLHCCSRVVAQVTIKLIHCDSCM